MPAFYAHYKFGQMVKNKIPAKYQRLLEDYQDLYEIGLHGPDILFQLFVTRSRRSALLFIMRRGECFLNMR